MKVFSCKVTRYVFLRIISLSTLEVRIESHLQHGYERLGECKFGPAKWESGAPMRCPLANPFMKNPNRTPYKVGDDPTVNKKATWKKEPKKRTKYLPLQREKEPHEAVNCELDGKRKDPNKCKIGSTVKAVETYLGVGRVGIQLC